MSLATTLRASLGPTVSQLLREFGHRATCKRATSTEALDGSAVKTWAVPVGMPATVQVLVKPLTAGQVRREWGPDSTATSFFLHRDTAPTALGDRFEFTTGPAAGAGIAWEVVELTKEDAGGIYYGGLKKVPLDA